MKIKTHFINSMFALLFMTNSVLASGTDFFCTEKGGQQRYILNIEPGQSSGSIKSVSSSTYSRIEEDKKRYPFTLGTPFDLGKSNHCIAWGCQGLCIPGLQDWYETGRKVCKKEAENFYIGTVPQSNDPFEQTLTVAIKTTTPKALGAPKISTNNMTIACYREDALKMHNGFSEIFISATGRVSFLQKFNDETTPALMETKYSAFDYTSESQTQIVSIRDILTSVDSGKLKKFSLNDYPENFDIRKVKSAVCWASKFRYELSIDSDIVKIHGSNGHITFEGSIAVIESRIKVAAGTVLVEPRLVLGKTFIFRELVCLGR